VQRSCHIALSRAKFLAPDVEGSPETPCRITTTPSCGKRVAKIVQGGSHTNVFRAEATFLDAQSSLLTVHGTLMLTNLSMCRTEVAQYCSNGGVVAAMCTHLDDQ
jgi:hypothetical protein